MIDRRGSSTRRDKGDGKKKEKRKGVVSGTCPYIDVVLVAVSLH